MLEYTANKKRKALAELAAKEWEEAKKDEEFNLPADRLEQELLRRADEERTQRLFASLCARSLVNLAHSLITAFTR